MGMNFNTAKAVQLALNLSLFAIIGPLCIGQSQPANINGHVSDASGQPLTGMTVLAVPYGTSFHGRLAHTITDERGTFKLVSGYTGRLRILAYNESAGYPNTFGALFTNPNDHFPIVDVKSGETHDDVDIVLPPPDGTISGLVRDARTGAIIPQARITLRWAEDPDVMYSSYLKGDGSFFFALPPRLITIEIVATGYTPWQYTDAKEHTGALLASGAKLNLSIHLEAAGNNASQ